jgi:hypothetical protein
MAFTDCELRDGWLFEQDVNAWSSAAYLVAGALILLNVARRAWPRAFAVLAAMTVLEGVGSLAYHGASTDAGAAMHDAALVGVLGFCAGWHARPGRAARAATAGALAAFLVALALHAAALAVTDAVVVGLVVVIASSIARDHRRGVSTAGSVGLAVLLAVALLTWAAGTPDSPLCEPDSLLQPHALWHVLTAAAITMWASEASRAGARIGSWGDG